jgi:poly(beta-D-mannuronate) lyase
LRRATVFSGIGISHAFVLFASLVATVPDPAAAEMTTGNGNCPNDPPLARVEAAPIYSDAKGSVVDADNLRLHEHQILPLRNFVTDASSRVDSDDRGERECALGMMRDWAKAGAMAQPPVDFNGLRELERFTISLNIIALKLRADGSDIAPLRDWLGTLNHTVIQRFEKRNLVDNLDVWSGVAGASYALLSGDEIARHHENEVWEQGIAAIRPDGFVNSELRRGARALSYHVYDLSALLTLNAFRNALGEPISAKDRAALAKLVDRVSGSLCEPSAMTIAAGGMVQEKVRPIVFAPIFAFAGSFADARMHSCGASDIPTTDPILGGDLNKTAAILANRHSGRAP